uniref:Galactosyltransferase n=1 Tax=Musca domestica TaxID=7370 RepID=T1PD96_MUSDO
MASNMHNTRLLRFLIVVSIVVLTIFIYASYSSTQTLAPPPMRNTAMASLMAFSMANKSSSGAGSNADVLEPVASANVKNNRAAPPYIRYENLPSAGGGGGSHGNDVVVIKKLTHHREPTIDENAIDGGGSDGPGTDVGAAGEAGTGGAEDLPLGGGGVGAGVGDDTALDHFNNQNNDLMQEEQYVQAVENNLVNINNSAASAGSGTGGGETKQQQQSPEGQQSQQQQQAQQNKISDSDVLIPTSNLQKFIESADKILKNISSQHQVMATADTINKSPDKYYLPLDPNNDDNEILDDNDEAQQPSVIMTIKGGAGDILSNINNKDNEKNADDNKNNNKNEAAKQEASAAVSSASAAGAAAAPSSASSAKTTATTKKAATKVQSADPTQGIPTQQIYEPGHMNEEIDIEQICPNKGDKLKLLILITSAQTHTEARLAIRQTWGHFGTRRDVSTAFILGRTTNATINEALTQENMIYGDLIRGHFIDSYNNLTLKTLSSLEWVDNHCPKAKYILKTDDDMFINVPKLLQFLDAHAKDKRVIYGRLAKKWKPIRNKKSKYYISTGQFNAAVFPPFTTGPAYVLTSDIVHELYVRSLHQVYLKLEDVFTTGIVAQQLGIKRVHVNEFLNRRIAFNPCNIRKSISVHMIKANEQFDLWKKLLDQTTKCK